jgi:hypothetical protein
MIEWFDVVFFTAMGLVNGWIWHWTWQSYKEWQESKRKLEKMRQVI